VLNPNTATGYSYSWENANNPGISISTTTQAINLLAGTYVLYAHYSDVNNLGQNYEGCTTTDTVSITQLSAIQSTGLITNVDCYAKATGSIVVSQIVGGTPSYTLQWNPGGQNTNLAAGTYTLTITDANNCQEVDTFEVTQPQALSTSISQNGYVLTATSAGGTAPVSYSWRSDSANFNIHLQGGATYTVTAHWAYLAIATDANGCEIISNTIAFTPPASWDCISGACVDPGTGNGTYASLSQCTASCISTELEESLVFDVLIYPNPFKEQTTVDFGRVIKEATISVVDVYGKQIEAYIISNADKHILKRNNKASGIYFVEIEAGEREKVIFKLIIE
jgi:hypothetical protein